MSLGEVPDHGSGIPIRPQVPTKSQGKHFAMGTVRQQGFNLLELLIAVAIVGIVSAIAIPAYRSYTNTANESKVNSAFQNAVRIAQSEYAKNDARVSMGLPATLPKSRTEWVKRFDPEGTRAPGGGPIYNLKGAMGRPDEVGAVTVEYTNGKATLQLIRPAYLNLKRATALIDSNGVTIQQ